MNTNDEKLLQAAMKGSLKNVQAACEAGADVNAQHPDWGTALYIACEFGNTNIARYLLKQPGINITKGRPSLYPMGVAGCVIAPKKRVMHNHTPLYIAVCQNNLTIVRLLLKHEDSAKYLMADDDWENTIKGAFNYIYKSEILDELLNAEASAPENLLRSLGYAIEKALYRGTPLPELAKSLRKRPGPARTLAFCCATDHILRLVREADNDTLASALKFATDFGTPEQLRPYLIAAHRLAQQLGHTECEELLCARL